MDSDRQRQTVMDSRGKRWIATDKYWQAGVTLRFKGFGLLVSFEHHESRHAACARVVADLFLLVIFPCICHSIFLPLRLSPSRHLTICFHLSRVNTKHALCVGSNQFRICPETIEKQNRGMQRSIRVLLVVAVVLKWFCGPAPCCWVDSWVCLLLHSWVRPRLKHALYV